jgi:carbon monoxide dehydrogenase subunit G
MLVEGTGSGGSIKGSAQFAFSENNGATEIQLVGDAQVTGMIARVGQRLMGTASRMLMNQFFACLKDKIEA